MCTDLRERRGRASLRHAGTTNSRGRRKVRNGALWHPCRAAAAGEGNKLRSVPQSGVRRFGPWGRPHLGQHAAKRSCASNFFPPAQRIFSHVNTIVKLLESDMLTSSTQPCRKHTLRGSRGPPTIARAKRGARHRTPPLESDDCYDWCVSPTPSSDQQVDSTSTPSNQLLSGTEFFPSTTDSRSRHACLCVSSTATPKLYHLEQPESCMPSGRDACHGNATQHEVHHLLSLAPNSNQETHPRPPHMCLALCRSRGRLSGLIIALCCDPLQIPAPSLDTLSRWSQRASRSDTPIQTR